MKFKKTLLLVLLLATGLIYFGVFFWIIPDFMESSRRALEEQRELLSDIPPSVREKLLETPFEPSIVDTRRGSTMFLIGLGLIPLWIIGFHDLSEAIKDSDLKLLALLALTLSISGLLCLFLGNVVCSHYEPTIYGQDFPYPYRNYFFPLILLGIVLLGFGFVVLKHAILPYVREQDELGKIYPQIFDAT